MPVYARFDENLSSPGKTCGIVRNNSPARRRVTGCRSQIGVFSEIRSGPINREAKNNMTVLPRLVLASSSQSRSRMLADAGIPFDRQPVRIDEEAIRAAMEAEGASARDVADALGEFKARKGLDKHPDAVVLGSDQVLAFKGRLFAKPEDREAAARQIADLQGQTHILLSSAVIYHDGGPIWRTVGQARMTMHRLSTAEIDAYLDRAWPDVGSSVGAYHAESLGARLFSRIDGDWFTVMGLPLLDVLSFLRLRGWLPA